MNRTTKRIVLGLLLLVGAAFLFHRGAREEKPRRPSLPPAVEAPASEAPTLAVAPPVEAAPSPATRGSPPAPPIPEVPVAVVPEPLKGGTVRGVVKVGSSPPKRRRAQLKADLKCAEIHPAGLLTDDIVVDPENNVRWAFVHVAHGVKDPPKGLLTPVLLDQVGCRFDPHVLGLRVHQPLNIYNNDRLLHNVHMLAFENREVNFALPQAGLYRTLSFARPEVMIKINCDVHPWMIAWVGVLDHPYFSVTSETGSYGIVDLASGRYVIKVWHEKYADVERDVEVPPGGDVRLDFMLDAKKR